MWYMFVDEKEINKTVEINVRSHARLWYALGLAVYDTELNTTPRGRRFHYQHGRTYYTNCFVIIFNRPAIESLLIYEHSCTL